MEQRQSGNAITQLQNTNTIWKTGSRAWMLTYYVIQSFHLIFVDGKQKIENFFGCRPPLFFFSAELAGSRK